MKRKLLAVLAVLPAAVGVVGTAFAFSPLAEAGQGGATQAPAARAALPMHGTYSGVDHAGRVISFTFSGNYMSHFTVNHTVIGGAHVGSNAWHETCHNNMCTKGVWVTDTHVTGSWRHGNGHWVHFSAWLHPSVTPYQGSYMGRDHTGLSVRFSYRNGIHNLTLDHNSHGSVTVTNGRFETCLATICVKGQWQTEYEVAGSWRPRSGTHWTQWDAHAFAP
jgi:hypothetical protein